MTTNIQILNILVDNSNPNYIGAIIKVWWRLNCIAEKEFVSYQCSTDMSPSFDNNFIPYSDVTNEMLTQWILDIEGSDYIVLKKIIEKSVENQMNISSYDADYFEFLGR